MRKFKTLKKRLVAGALTLALAVAVVPVFQDGVPVLADESIDDIEKEKEEIEEKKQEAQAQLDDLNVLKNDVTDVIAQLDVDIDGYQQKINALVSQRNDIQASVAITESKLQNAYIAEKKQYNDMKERIRFAYETGDKAYLDALMTVKNYDDIINQPEYVSQVSDYDKEQLEKLAQIEAEVVAYEAELSEKLESVNALKKEAEDEQAALVVVQDEKKEKLEEYNTQIFATEESIAEYEAEQQALDAQIAAIQEEMERQRQAAIEAARQAEAQQMTVDETIEAYAYAPTYDGGGLVWPMPSCYDISSPFGPRWGDFHRGIDIPCAEGSSVVAACGGIVSFVGVYHWSTGNSILIDCGNGMTNMYYHLSGYNVSPGQVVNAGDCIGFSGNTGNSTGPHLHFGVMINGEYYDPQSFF